MNLRIYLHYFKRVLGINTAFSLLIGVLAGADGEASGTAFLIAFSVGFVTVGYMLSVMIFHFFVRKTRFLYYNMGISLWRLYAFGFLVNVLIVLSLLLIAGWLCK